MKKLISLILSVMFIVSFAACAQKPAENTQKSSSAVNEFKPKEVVLFTDILDNLGNKDYYYLDTTGNTIKILDKAPFKAYSEKSSAITKKAMEDAKVDTTKMKVYNFYRNVNGQKLQKDYVVVYDANKVPSELYEVTMTINDKDEPALKETKKLDKTIDDNFKKLFAGEVK